MNSGLIFGGLEGIGALALIVAAALVPAAASSVAPPPARAEAPLPPETKDRLSQKQMEALIDKPMALVREGRRAEADAAFNALVGAARARGDKVRVADLLTSYGVALYLAGDADDPGDTRRIAIPWLEQAVTATREAWGRRHPETALALQDYGDVLRKTAPDAPPPEAERALREALAIRRETLGAGNGETLVTMLALADILSAGPPAPPRYEEARRLYEAVIAGVPRTPMIKPLEESVNARIGLALLHARAGRSADALSGFKAAVRELGGQRQAEGGAAACLELAAGRDKLAKRFDEKGLGDLARAVRESFTVGGVECLAS